MMTLEEYELILSELSSLSFDQLDLRRRLIEELIQLEDEGRELLIRSS